MLDATKVVTREQFLRLDPEGHMYDLPMWSPRIAAQIAAEEGIAELTETHWQIIFCLRGRQRDQGRAANAREVLRELEREYSDLGGRRYLYQLFPGGPVSQGCRIAGVPAPPYSHDDSFGSSC